MSRDNRIQINAGGSVRMDAVAVGDHARAASVRSPQHAQIAEQFLAIRSELDRLEASGAVRPAEAGLLKDEAAEVEQAAEAALEDEAAKETLELKLKRFAGSVRSFCREQDQSGVFSALQTVASVCAIPLALLGLPTL
jgi:hypothetical protein